MNKSEIIKIITSEDYEARSLFNADFEDEIGQLSGIFAKCFELLEVSDCAKDHSDRAGIVAGYLHLAIESAVTASQFLSLGHIAGAGNSMRISYESLCFSVLLKKEVKIKDGKQYIHFYNEYIKNSPCARAHKVLDLVTKNRELLGLNHEGATFIRTAKNFYNGYSHAGHMLIYSKVKPSTRQWYVGGGYDRERKELFATQIKFISRYSKHLPDWIRAVAYNG